MKNDRNNPAPFLQPFLRLWVKTAQGQREEWLLDVRGQIGKYVGRNHLMTDLLKEMVTRLSARGYVVTHYDKYVGSAGPSHVLLEGAIFRRMYDELEQAKPFQKPAKPPVYGIPG